MIELNYRILAGFSAVYLALLPTNHGTFFRSVAFGGIILCALGVLFWQSRPPRPPTALLVPSPPRGLTWLFFAWCIWSGLSIFWSAKRDYSLEQLGREVLDSAIVVAGFYVAARGPKTLRWFGAAVLASLLVMGALALQRELVGEVWDASLKHHGVGPWSTFVVLAAPLLLGLFAPSGLGLKNRYIAATLACLLLTVIVCSARLTDNRMVWIALAAVFLTAGVGASLRWSNGFSRSALGWLLPVAALMVILALAFADTAREKATAFFPPNTSVEQTLKRDPRLALWDYSFALIGERPLTGYGFGRRILVSELTTELKDPALTHAHNLFVSQWLQTGLVGLLLFASLLIAVAATFVRYLRSRDELLAFIGLIGLSVLAGFVVKNLTDDFLFRSNAKEFWALLAICVGFGTRRERAPPSTPS